MLMEVSTGEADSGCRRQRRLQTSGTLTSPPIRATHAHLGALQPGPSIIRLPGPAARPQRRLAVVAMKVVHPGESGQAVGCDTHRRDRRIARMNIHKNARLTPPGRLLLVQRVEGGGWGLA